MAQNIVLAKNLDTTKLTYDTVKKNALGGNIVYVKYEERPKLTMQTCEVTAPFGLGTYTDEKTGAVKYSLDVSFRGMEEDAKIKAFHDKMMDLDETLLNEGVVRSKEWFNKKMTKEVVENFYRPLVKPAKDPTKYAPTMKIKIHTNRSDNVSVDCYDHKRNKVDIKELVPGSKVQALLECSSIWFVGKNMFGISWKLVQLKIAKSDKITGFSFIDDSDEEEYEEVTDEEIIE